MISVTAHGRVSILPANKLIIETTAHGGIHVI